MWSIFQPMFFKVVDIAMEAGQRRIYDALKKDLRSDDR